MENNEERLKILENEQIQMINLIKILSEEVKKPKINPMVAMRTGLANDEISWTITSSSSGDKEELLKIVEMLKEVEREEELSKKKWQNKNKEILKGRDEMNNKSEKKSK